jgi:hypothetical protein
MSTKVGLTCAQIPLAWPSSVSLDDVTPCSTCGIRVFSPTAGSGQLSARPARDGITVTEAANVGADYQGQRYTIDECVFHTPGLHVFPGQTDVYPAEYHIYMTSVSQPVRTIAIIIPVSHKTQDAGDEAGVAYFAAITSQPDPAQTVPFLHTLLVPGTPVLQYLGVDVRTCATDPNSPEIQYLLVQRVMGVRAADLERIPREGTGSTLPDALPLPGARPTQAVARDVLLKSTLLAKPGILSATPTLHAPTPVEDPTAYSCKPIQVVDGKDVIVTDASGIPLVKVLAGGSDVSGGTTTGNTNTWMYHAVTFVSTMAGLLLADMIFSHVWNWFFHDSERLRKWVHLKVILFLVIAIMSMANPTMTRDVIYSLIAYIYPAD